MDTLDLQWINYAKDMHIQRFSSGIEILLNSFPNVYTKLIGSFSLQIILMHTFV